MRVPEAASSPKIRELRSHHFDAPIRNNSAFRPDDIVIATYARSGTTWVQQLVSQLVFARAADVPVGERSNWESRNYLTNSGCSNQV